MVRYKNLSENEWKAKLCEKSGSQIKYKDYLRHLHSSTFTYAKLTELLNVDKLRCYHFQAFGCVVSEVVFLAFCCHWRAPQREFPLAGRMSRDVT